MKEYKEAFEELYGEVRETEDEVLRLKALRIKERLVEEDESQEDESQEDEPAKKTVTKKSIMAIKNDNERQNAIKENLHLFN